MRLLLLLGSHVSSLFDRTVPRIFFLRLQNFSAEARLELAGLIGTLPTLSIIGGRNSPEVGLMNKIPLTCGLTYSVDHVALGTG
jgi:hypothetical protein